MLVFIIMFVLRLEQCTRLKDYLEASLHIHVELRGWENTNDLPVFLYKNFCFQTGCVLGQDILFAFADPSGKHTPLELAEQSQNIAKHYGSTVVLVLDGLSSHNRSRLIHRAVPFVVPGNQLYMPNLALDLRENFRSHPLAPVKHLTPSAQTVIFHCLLDPNFKKATPTDLAKVLGYSAMSIGRAFEQLRSFGVAKLKPHGRKKFLSLGMSRRETLKRIEPVMRSPLKKSHFVRGKPPEDSLLSGGETALSALTSLAPPRLRCFAASGAAWKTLSRTYGEVVDEKIEADFQIDVWSYDPKRLSQGTLVDPLSLRAQFLNHPDERVARSAEDLLEQLTW